MKTERRKFYFFSLLGLGIGLLGAVLLFVQVETLYHKTVVGVVTVGLFVMYGLVVYLGRLAEEIEVEGNEVETEVPKK